MALSRSSVEREIDVIITDAHGRVWRERDRKEEEALLFFPFFSPVYNTSMPWIIFISRKVNAPGAIYTVYFFLIFWAVFVVVVVVGKDRPYTETRLCRQINFVCIIITRLYILGELGFLGIHNNLKQSSLSPPVFSLRRVFVCSIDRCQSV